MIVSIEGSDDSGKNSLMKKLIGERSKQTNQDIILCGLNDIQSSYISKANIVSTEDFIKMTSNDFCDKIIGLDEVYLYMDSNFSGSAMNRLFTDIIISSANRNADFYIGTKTFDCLEKRIRRGVDYHIVCKGVKHDKFLFVLSDMKNSKDYSGSLKREELLGIRNDLVGIKKSIGVKI